MGSNTVLVVDDEPRYLRLLRANLESLGYRVVAAADGGSAVQKAEADDPDLVVLDLMLPDLDGYEVCRQIREFSTVPIIMLTARRQQADKVRGLDLGADDYLTKPFDAEELLARVRAQLRRSSFRQQRNLQPPFALGDLAIDFAQHRVSIRGKEVALSPTEYRLLFHLATNAGRVLVQEELLRLTWGADYVDEPDVLRVYVRRLRQKVEDDPSSPCYILTRPGIGYTMPASH
ncbi:MAG: response regulator transcription factor [Chloroflexota bacterium]